MSEDHQACGEGSPATGAIPTRIREGQAPRAGSGATRARPSASQLSLWLRGCGGGSSAGCKTRSSGLEPLRACERVKLGVSTRRVVFDHSGGFSQSGPLGILHLGGQRNNGILPVVCRRGVLGGLCNEEILTIWYIQNVALVTDCRIGTGA